MKNNDWETQKSEVTGESLRLALSMLLILGLMILWPGTGFTKGNMVEGDEAARAFPDMVPALNSVVQITKRPEYLGLSAAEIERLTGPYQKQVHQMSQPSMSTDLFEIFVAIFSKGDKDRARSLRGNSKFKEAVMVLIDQSATPDKLNLALSILSEISNMNRAEMMTALSNIGVDAPGMNEAKKSALSGNLAVANVANAMAATKNNLKVDDFNSPNVLARREGVVASVQPTNYQGTPDSTPPEFGGSAIDPDAPDDYQGGRVNSPDLGSGSSSPMPNLGAKAGRLGSQIAKGMGHGPVSPGIEADKLGTRSNGPLGANLGTSDLAQTPTAAAAAAKAANDPMLSILGGDYANSKLYNSDQKNGSGVNLNGQPRILADYSSCRGPQQKTGESIPLSALCQKAECAKTVECECYQTFTKKVPHSDEVDTPAIKLAATPKLCPIGGDRKLCAQDIKAVDHDKMGSLLKEQVGDYQEQAATGSAATYKEHATGLIKSLNDWLEKGKGKKFGPTERLSLIMNVLAGTNRGLCLLSNGKEELPFGENKGNKPPFEFYESIADDVNKKNLPPACGQLDSTDLSGDWGSRDSDRLQIGAFFHVLDQMRVMHTNSTMLERNRVVAAHEEASSVLSFEDRIMNPQGLSLEEGESKRGSNALARALDPSCKNGWLAVLESAEIQLRPLALHCRGNISPQFGEVPVASDKESLKDIACEVNPKPKRKLATGSNTKEEEFEDQMPSADSAAGKAIDNEWTLMNKDIRSGFLLDYLKLKKDPTKGTARAPASGSDECANIVIKYSNINKLLTRRYQGESKSAIKGSAVAIKDSEFCKRYQAEYQNGRHGKR